MFKQLDITVPLKIHEGISRCIISRLAIIKPRMEEDCGHFIHLPTLSCSADASREREGKGTSIKQRLNGTNQMCTVAQSAPNI